MWFVNRPLGWVFDLVVLPFRGMPAIVGLTVISLVVSVGMLIGFRAVSDQDALDAVKRRIHGGVYEIRLYKDDLRTIFAAQVGILRETGTYFRLSLVPMLWMMVPIVIIVSQLQFQYGYESLEPGQSALVKVELTEEAADRVAATDGAGVSLEVPDGVRLETPSCGSLPSGRPAGASPPRARVSTSSSCGSAKRPSPSPCGCRGPRCSAPRSARPACWISSSTLRRRLCRGGRTPK